VLGGKGARGERKNPAKRGKRVSAKGNGYIYRQGRAGRDGIDSKEALCSPKAGIIGAESGRGLG